MTVTPKQFFRRDGVEYVRDGDSNGAARPARPGEKFAYVADLVHERRQPYGRSRRRRR